MPEIAQSTRTRIHHSIRIASSIDRSLIASESALADTKWFEYRFMSPWWATVLFARAYQETFKSTFRSEIDFERAHLVKGTDESALYNRIDSRERTQLWRARQRADEVGMRYEEYIEAAFVFSLRRKRHFLPRPSQLHFPGDAQGPWVQFRDKFWQERLDNGAVRIARDLAYRIENFSGLPAQIAYRQLLVELTMKSTRSLHDSMRLFALEKRQIPIDAFAAILPEDIFQSAVANLEAEERLRPTSPDPMTPLAQDGLWPSCFGLPSAYSPAQSPCIYCTKVKQCLHIADLVSRKVKETTGSAAPVEDHKRRMARIRKRKQRQIATSALTAKGFQRA